MKPLIFTASCYAVCGGRVLLHRHKKYGIWMPPGGKLRPGELPHEAALRELREETGLEAALLSPMPPPLGDVAAAPLPYCCYRAEDDAADYFDQIYFAKSDTAALSPGDGESRTLRWFSAAELKEAALPPHVRRLAEAALKAASD